MKKIVYTLGALAAIVTPVVAVVSCGSSKVEKVNGLETGSISDFFKNPNNQANVKIEKNGNGELVELGGDVSQGFKYLVKSDMTNEGLQFDGQHVVDKKYVKVSDGLRDQVITELLKSSSFVSKILDQFQFITIVSIDVNDKSLKATKNIFLPQIAKASDSESFTDWTARATKVLGAMIGNQQLSYSPSVIPVTAYDAPASNALSFDYEDDITKLVRIQGQKIPQRKTDYTLPSALVKNFAERTLRNENTVQAMSAGETEYAVSFYNQMYISNIANIMHIDASNVFPRIVRENMLVANDSTNDPDIPFAHIPQNPTNFERTLSNFTNKLQQVKFVTPDKDFIVKTSPFDSVGYTLTFSNDRSEGLAAKATSTVTNQGTQPTTINYLRADGEELKAYRQEFATKVLANSYVTQLDKSNSITGKIELTSQADAYVAIHDAQNGYIKLLSQLDDAKLNSWEPLNDDTQITDENQKVIFNAFKIIAKSMWLNGSFKNGHGSPLTLIEIRDAIKNVVDFESGAATATLDNIEEDYILSTLFDWTATRVYNLLYSWAWFDKDSFAESETLSGQTGLRDFTPTISAVKYTQSQEGITKFFEGKYLARNKDIYKINWAWDDQKYQWVVRTSNKYGKA